MFKYYYTIYDLGMQCEICGLILDSVDDSQTERDSHLGVTSVKFYCEAHKPVEIILS